MKQELIAFVLAFVFVAIVTAAEAEVDKLVPSVSVTGSGEAGVKPDMASIQVGVVTQGQTAGEALKANSEAMAKLLETLAGQGIADKDIQTTNVNVNPQYQNSRDGRNAMHIIGYEANNTVHVKIRQLGSLGNILDDVVSKGANRMNGVTFGVAEPRPVLDQARQKAMADARHKAELYASAAGMKLGRVLLIQEQAPHIPRAEPMVMARAALGAGPVPIASGEQEFRASINVTYALEP